MSQDMEKNGRGHWEISDTYSGLQMSAILMNTPKIWFPGISQDSSKELGSSCTPKQTGDRSDP